MSRTALAAVIAAAGVVGGAASASAAFDFTNLGADNTPLPSSVSDGGVTANGYVYTGGTSYTDTELWLRNVPGDRGLGVCSEGTSACMTGGGDVNELDNNGSREVIRLEAPDGEQWTSLWVSSLDSGGSGGAEKGTVFFSNSATLNINQALLNGDFVRIEFGDFGASVQGDIFTLASVTSDPDFDPTAKYVYFIAGPNADGNNNDYLVWKGDTAPIPIPAALPMLLAAVGGLGFAGWRSNRRVA